MVDFKTGDIVKLHEKLYKVVFKGSVSFGLKRFFITSKGTRIGTRDYYHRDRDSVEFATLNDFKKILKN